MDKITTKVLIEMKKKGEKIAVLTGYDYTMAKLLNEAGVEVILVGDSLGMVKLGYENTLPVTMDEMLLHCKAVKKGNSKALIVADMPFLSCEINAEETVRNAGRFVKEGFAEAVKIEGGEEIVNTVKAVIKAKIPVMGHIGLTPQSIHQMGGYKVQGKDRETAEKLIASAKALEEAGIFSLVLECIPEELAGEITSKISVPTIGIGAGVKCDGQVLVLDDMLGLFSDIKPKFVKQYLNLKPQIIDAVKTYCEEVKSSKFPAEEHTYK